MTAVNLRKYGAGSRKRIARIRWTRAEILHAVLLAVLMTVFSIWVGFWIATHYCS